MNILGIDYGRKKIGLAIGNSFISEPYMVIRYQNIDIAVKKIKEIIKKAQIDKVVVGVSEGQMGDESKGFAKVFKADLFDETLTSKDAIKMSIASGIGPKKRKVMEDAYAASIMLQNYIDNFNQKR